MYKKIYKCHKYTLQTSNCDVEIHFHYAYLYKICIKFRKSFVNSRKLRFIITQKNPILHLNSSDVGPSNYITF